LAHLWRADDERPAGGLHGDVGGGLAYAGRVLDSLPVQHYMESVYAIGRAAMRVVPTQERGRPEAAELRARLAFSPSEEE
jgi:hypothetical protein